MSSMIPLPKLPQTLEFISASGTLHAYTAEQLQAIQREAMRSALLAVVDVFKAHPLMDLQPSDVIDIVSAMRIEGES